MINDTNYWETFYEKHPENKIPSNFAVYINSVYLNKNKTLLELGCGNGRDAIYFVNQGLKVTAIDLATKEIDYLKKLNIQNITFKAHDFTKLYEYSNFDFVYSRFTLHSINEDSEDSVLSQLNGVLKPRVLFLLEARSIKDKNLEKEFGIDHYRRYIDLERITKKIEAKGFTIIESIESQDLAKYKGENPYIIRIIARASG
jgi:tellurite methyltransferase